MKQLPTSRKEAREKSETQYFTGKPCKHGHVAAKFTCSGSCTLCLADRRRAYMQKWSKENPEKKKQKAAQWYENNKEEIIERVRTNYYKDIEKSRERARQYAVKNAQKARERIKKWNEKNPERKKSGDKIWIENNRAKNHSYKAKYRASRRQACPPWVNQTHMERIHAIYRLRREISEQTGVIHEVDHIVPLQGKTVCGLHVWWNLRVIPRVDNNRRPRVWIPE